MRVPLAIAILTLTAFAFSVASAAPTPSPLVPHVVPCGCFSAFAFGTAQFEHDAWIVSDEPCVGTTTVTLHVAFHELRFELAGLGCEPNAAWGFDCEVAEDGTHTCVEGDGPEFGVATLGPTGEFHFLSTADNVRIDGHLLRLY